MNKKITLFSIIESFYIFYMYNLFKTRISFHSPLEIIIQNKNINNFISHPVSTGIYESKICPLGNYVSIILVIWIILRIFLKKNIIKINNVIFSIVLICTFILNINSFIYFIPVYIYEFFIFPKLISKI
jgi:hypothetical protein